ncbi:hypothetical protein [Vibrio barjaei]|jgi:hypothetical protein|uniref:Uncharacterized protein n=1 Tax=Vibrio barjaei TaxID=1676683 RepID=A0ABW7IDU2_9VIBR|nr:hypothetical protein [Vibrio barjaei]MCG9788802.1 hypothetical protein [Vibrio mediterranei]MCY9874234.1 hypothetical protein [Vibrio barjaei]OIN23934.1 hypothetical protein AWH66_2002160 [Vibrio barjaei]
MNGTQTALLNNLNKGHKMSTQQFEQLREQLKLLSPQQLKALHGEISNQLSPSAASLLSDEEMSALTQLFQ